MIVQPLDFEKLVGAIHQVHAELATQASRAVNVSLALRNWMIGCYITEYEQNGADRAKYGERLLGRLSESLSPKGVSRVEECELRRYRQFYQTYPQIRETISPELHQRLLGSLVTGDIEKRESATPEFFLPGKELIGRLSFSHFVELLQFDEPVQRAFYEIECIRGNWSVRELKRQIGSLYYERSGLSRNKKKLSDMVRQCAQTVDPTMTVHAVFKEALNEVRQNEIQFINDWIIRQIGDSTSAEKDIIALGDFNANPKGQPHHFDAIVIGTTAYRVLMDEPKAAGEPSLRTTVQQSNNPEPDFFLLPVYDHILVSPHVGDALPHDPMTRRAGDLGIVKFDQDGHWKGYSWNEVIRAMSDHRPVWFKLAYDAADLD